MLQACDQRPFELLSFQPIKCFAGNVVGISLSLVGCWLSSCCAFGSGWLAVCPGKAGANRKGRSPKQASVQAQGMITPSHPWGAVGSAVPGGWGGSWDPLCAACGPGASVILCQGSWAVGEGLGEFNLAPFPWCPLPFLPFFFLFLWPYLC